MSRTTRNAGRGQPRKIVATAPAARWVVAGGPGPSVNRGRLRLFSVAALPCEPVDEPDRCRERPEHTSSPGLVEAVEDPGDIDGCASHALATSYVPGETTPVLGGADLLDQGERIALLVVEVPLSTG